MPLMTSDWVQVIDTTMQVAVAAVVGFAAWKAGDLSGKAAQRSADISDRTAELSEKQTQASMQQVKHSLYEKRMDIYDLFMDLIDNYRQLDWPGTFSWDVDTRCLRPLRRVPFLFRPEVAPYLTSLIADAKIMETGFQPNDPEYDQKLNRFERAKERMEAAATRWPAMVRDDLNLVPSRAQAPL